MDSLGVIGVVTVNTVCRDDDGARIKGVRLLKKQRLKDDDFLFCETCGISISRWEGRSRGLSAEGLAAIRVKDMLLGEGLTLSYQALINEPRIRSNHWRTLWDCRLRSMRT